MPGISLTKDRLRCLHCAEVLQITPSLSILEEANWKAKHMKCGAPSPPATDPYQAKDWQLRGSPHKEHLM